MTKIYSMIFIMLIFLHSYQSQAQDIQESIKQGWNFTKKIIIPVIICSALNAAITTCTQANNYKNENSANNSKKIISNPRLIATATPDESGTLKVCVYEVDNDKHLRLTDSWLEEKKPLE